MWLGKNFSNNAENAHGENYELSHWISAAKLRSSPEARAESAQPAYVCFAAGWRERAVQLSEVGGSRGKAWSSTAAPIAPRPCKATSSAKAPKRCWWKKPLPFRPPRHPRRQPWHLGAAGSPVDELSDEQWRSTMAINLDSAFLLVKSAVKAMKHRSAAATS